MAEEFLFDDYFSDEKDRGVEVVIPFKGKPLPFRVKRSLSLNERKAANDAAIKIEIGDDMKPHMVGQVDQAAFTTEILLVGLKYWPFEYSPGKPVPINRKTVEAINGELASEIASRILGITEVKPEVLDHSERESEDR